MNFEKNNNGIYIPKYQMNISKGLYLPSDLKISERPKMFSFFSGIGGFDLGFIKSGFDVIGANEYAPEPLLTYMVNFCSYPVNIHYIEGDIDKSRLNKACAKHIFNSNKEYIEEDKIKDLKIKQYSWPGSGWIKNHPEYNPVQDVWFGDIRKLKGKDILNALGLKQGDIDCVCGGPPCQGFSTAGKQDIADPRNNLVYEYARMIVELQPKTFVMEEVPAIINFFDPDGVPVLDKFSMILSEGGYGAWKNIKKALMFQSGSAVMKGMVKDKSIKKATKAKPMRNAVVYDINILDLI